MMYGLGSRLLLVLFLLLILLLLLVLHMLMLLMLQHFPWPSDLTLRMKPLKGAPQVPVMVPLNGVPPGAHYRCPL